MLGCGLAAVEVVFANVSFTSAVGVQGEGTFDGGQHPVDIHRQVLGQSTISCYQLLADRIGEVKAKDAA